MVACDRYVARDAADAIAVEYEPLPAVVDPDKAMTGQPAVLHAGFPNNVALGPLPSGTGVSRDGAVDDTAVDAAFEAADLVIAQRMVNQRLAPSSIEARGVVAHYEPGREALTIWSSTQNPHILRTFMAQLLDLGEDRVRAIAPEVGGGFGAKINIYGEEYVAAALSRRLALPIKWIEDRSEAFLATVHGSDLIGYVELAATRDGKVLGLRMRIIADIGAYNMLLTARVPTHSMTMANATYAFPAIRATLTEVFTNKTPTDAYRGAGRPEAAYFVERAMDMLARELEVDPADLRRKNFIQPDQFPYRTQMGAVYDSGDYEKALDHAPDQAARGADPGTERRGVLRADEQHLSVRLPHCDDGDRPGDRRAAAAEDGGGGRRRPPDQSAHRRGADPRRARAGHRAGADRGGRLRRRRPAADRVVHGLRAAAGERLPALRARQHRDPDPGQSARRQGGGRSRNHRLDALHRKRGGRRPQRPRGAAPRHAAAAREAVAHRSGH